MVISLAEALDADVVGVKATTLAGCCRPGSRGPMGS